MSEVYMPHGICYFVIEKYRLGWISWPYGEDRQANSEFDRQLQRDDSRHHEEGNWA